MHPTVLSGDVPSPLNPPSGCCFHARRPHATDECRRVKPQLRQNAPGHFTACHLCQEVSQTDGLDPREELWIPLN